MIQDPEQTPSEGGQKKPAPRWLALGIVIAAAVLVIFAIQFGIDRSEQKPEPASILVSAINLDAKYSVNEVKADQDFKGERLRVWGAVARVSQGTQDPPFVVLRPEAGGGLGVQCMFKQSDARTLAGIIPGEGIMIDGDCEGRLRKMVMLRKCRLVSKSSDASPDRPRPGPRGFRLPIGG